MHVLSPTTNSLSAHTIPKAIVALRHLSSVWTVAKLDWINDLVSSDCDAWYMDTTCLCIAWALKKLYTASLVREKIIVLGIVDRLSVVARMRARPPKSLCADKI